MEWIRKHQTIWKKIGILAGVYLGMKYLVPLLIPFLIALLVVYRCWPWLTRLQKRLHIRPAVTMGLLLLVVLLMAAAGGALIGRSLRNLLWWAADRLSAPGEAKRLLYECCDGFSELLQLEAEEVRVFVTEQLNVFRDEARQTILPGAFGGSWSVLKSLGSGAAALLVTGVAVLLTASDFERIRELARACPWREPAAASVRGILRSAGGYLRAQCIIIGLVTILCTAGIWISGTVRNPLPAGVGIGLLDALPVFGTGTALLPWALLLLLQKQYGKALILALTYAVCVLTRELLEPRLIGGRLGLLPVLVLASVYAGVQLYGFGGILLGPLSVLLVRELWSQADAAEKARVNLDKDGPGALE